MKKPHISVVIPVYNEEAILRHCLDAISAQSHKPDVVYIVNNNSTDRSLEIAHQYKFVTVIHEKRQGICVATKTVFDAAARHAGIILRCDADSRPYPDWIERTITLFHQEDIVAVTGPGTTYDAGLLKRKIFDYTYMKPYFFLVGLALGHAPLFGSNFGLLAETWRAIANETHLEQHQNIHDDIDISHHVRGRTYYDPTLRMPISMRPFRSVKKMIRRYGAGFRSLTIHWPDQAPWKRFMTRR